MKAKHLSAAIAVAMFIAAPGLAWFFTLNAYITAGLVLSTLFNFVGLLFALVCYIATKEDI